MNKFSSYSIDRDYGFAPNPFWGYCTLATCKPVLRGHVSVGDYVAGFGGKNTGQLHKLIYLMKVEEIMTFSDYWNDPRFQNKKPSIYGSLKTQYGDNIYHQDANGNWIQANSHHSLPSSPNLVNQKNDTSYDAVLISHKEWWYFGDQAIELPACFNCFIHKRGHKNFYNSEDFMKLVSYVADHYPSRGRSGDPNKWKSIKAGTEGKK